MIGDWNATRAARLNATSSLSRTVLSLRFDETCVTAVKDVRSDEELYRRPDTSINRINRARSMLFFR